MLDIQEFFVEGGDQERSHVLLHITEPSTREERAKGYFFALSEINQGTREQIERWQELIDEAEKRYYETEAEGDKDAFEMTLEYINRRGHHILATRGSEVHCIIGTLRDQAISFAYHGKPHAVLFYGAKEGTGHMNIIGSDSDEAPSAQLFSAIMQGSMNPGDYFFIATPHVNQFLSLDRIEKLVFGKPVKQSAVHMEKVLGALRNGTSYGGILAHFLTKEEIPRTGKLPKYLVGAENPAPPTSLSNRERRTDALLSPPLIKNSTAKFKEYLAEKKKNREEARTAQPRMSAGSETNYRPRAHDPNESMGNTIVVASGRALVTGLVVFFRFLKKIIFAGGRFVTGLILVITNRGGQRETVLDNFKGGLKDRQQAVENLPLVSKLLFAGVVILAIVFVGGIMYARIKENREAKTQAVEQQITAIREKKDLADGRLIYGNDTEALQLLNEAKAMVEALPKDSPRAEKAGAGLNDEIASILKRLQKMTTLSPTLVADIGAAASDVKTERLVALDGTLIAFGPADDRLYRIDPDTKSVEAKDHSTLKQIRAASTPKENDTTVFVSGDAGLAEYQKDSGALLTKEISFPGASARIADLFVYNQRLYTVDAVNNQIYRHNKTQAGYDRGSAWLKDTADVVLSDAISLAIDGDLFVLKQSGDILKFTAGNRVAFSLTGVSPALAAPISLWTYNGVERLYILEQSEKRLVVTDKEGKLLKQYTAAEWQGPTGMVVDDEKKTAYILDSNKVWQISLE